MAMFQDLRPGDSIRVGTTTITVQAKTGARARLRIDSPEDVQVVRAEDASSDVADTTPRAPGMTPSAPAAKPTSLAVPALKFG
jgi:hypothetical protein